MGTAKGNAELNELNKERYIQAQADWDEKNELNPSYIKNKPNIKIYQFNEMPDANKMGEHIVQYVGKNGGDYLGGYFYKSTAVIEEYMSVVVSVSGKVTSTDMPMSLLKSVLGVTGGREAKLVCIEGGDPSCWTFMGYGGHYNLHAAPNETGVVVEGEVQIGDEIRFMYNPAQYKWKRINVQPDVPFEKGFMYLGIANSNTSAESPHQPSFYIAGRGEYPNFGFSVTNGLAIFEWKESKWEMKPCVIMGEGYTLRAGGGFEINGADTQALGLYSVAMGLNGKALGNYSVAMGKDNKVTSEAGTAVGILSQEDEKFLFTCGIGTPDRQPAKRNALIVAIDGKVFVIGAGGYHGTEKSSELFDSQGNLLKGKLDLASILNAFAVDPEMGSVAMGNMGNVIASGIYSKASGDGAVASGDYGATAEGHQTVARGDYGAHAEGSYTIASGEKSHAEGFKTQASGVCSHAGGCNTIAEGDVSHAIGLGNKTIAECECKCGKYSMESTQESLFTIGNGKAAADRSNALLVNEDGKHYVPGIGGYTGKNNYLECKDLAEIVNNKPDYLIKSMVYSLGADADTIPSDYNIEGNVFITEVGGQNVEGAVLFVDGTEYRMTAGQTYENPISNNSLFTWKVIKTDPKSKAVFAAKYIIKK